MDEWLANFGGSEYVRILMWVLGALLLVLLLFIIFRFFSGRTSGTFVSGGRNRLPRLAVVDAAAVDTQRRLVLVRRDDVEHLIMIGGPSDLVIEQQIERRKQTDVPHRQTPPVARPRPAPTQQPPQPAAPRVAPSPPRPESRPVGSPPLHGRPAPSTPPIDTPVVERPAPPPRQDPPEIRPEELRQGGAAQTLDFQNDPDAPSQIEGGVTRADASGELDMRPDGERHAGAQQSSQSDLSLEDEMSRLLNELGEDEKDDKR